MKVRLVEAAMTNLLQLLEGLGYHVDSIVVTTDTGTFIMMREVDDAS